MSKTPIRAGTVDLLPRFDPWIGREYAGKLEAVKAGEQVNGELLRVLVLGEAHYARPDDPESYVDTSSLTNDVIQDWAFQPSSGSAFFTRVASMVTGENPPSDREKAWHTFAFAEFVQTLVQGGPRVEPTPEQWADGRRRFFGLLARIRPTILVVLGSRLWDQLPAGEGAAALPMQLGPDRARVDDAWLYPYWADDFLGLTLAVRVVHPSAGFGHWKPEIAADRLQSCKFMYSNLIEFFEDAFVGVGEKPFWTDPSTCDHTNAESSFMIER